MRFIFATLCVTVAALRRHSSQQKEPTGYTTVSGCTCKPTSQCDSDLGTGYKCDTCKTEGTCGNWALNGRWDYCDYRPATRSSFISRTWADKVDYYWKNIVKNTTRYSKYPLLQNILSSVRTTFDNYQPEMPAGREKMIHTVGSVCKFDLTIGSNSPYTGLFAPGTQRGFVRLGGATDPGDKGLTPGLGIKFPRSGVHDGDIVMLYSLVLGDQWDFFARNQSNHLTPVGGFPTGILAKKFEEGTDCVFQIGISDMATYSQTGKKFSSPRFPFKLFMVANPALKTGKGELSLDAIHAEIDAIPVGTVLYDVYACGKPAGDEMEPTKDLNACGDPIKLGAMKTSSQCTTSYYGDASLHIRHQRIEEDWEAQPFYMNPGGSYKVNQVCGKEQDGVPPPRCGLDGMLSSDA